MALAAPTEAMAATAEQEVTAATVTLEPMSAPEQGGTLVTAATQETVATAPPPVESILEFVRLAEIRAWQELQEPLGQVELGMVQLAILVNLERQVVLE